ncbi:unnamed protein product [Ectocarpus sp. 8 AP-2014]
MSLFWVRDQLPKPSKNPWNLESGQRIMGFRCFEKIGWIPLLRMAATRGRSLPSKLYARILGFRCTEPLSSSMEAPISTRKNETVGSRFSSMLYCRSTGARFTKAIASPESKPSDFCSHGTLSLRFPARLDPTILGKATNISRAALSSRCRFFFNQVSFGFKLSSTLL